MGPSVRLLLPSGVVREMPLGATIGRSPHNAIRLDDPAISEAHALLSWRSGELRLVALRRRFSLRGQIVEEARLFEGDEIELAPGVVLEVLEVTLPHEVLVLEGPGLPSQLLPDVAALVLGPPPSLSTRIAHDAAAILWQSPDAPPPGVKVRRSDGSETHVGADGCILIGDLRFTLRAVPTGAVADAATGRPSDREPLSVELCGEDCVRIADVARGIEFQGVQGRLLHILASARASCDWPTLAGRVWSDRADWDALRSRLDTTVSRIRRRLREVGFQPALLRTDGSGGFVLALESRDSVWTGERQAS